MAKWSRRKPGWETFFRRLNQRIVQEIENNILLSDDGWEDIVQNGHYFR